MRAEPNELRFWKYVDRGGADECWPWTGFKNAKGYGMLADHRKNRPKPAHRQSYELHKGPIPVGLIVRHTCDNPSCVNPRHLLVGTHAENARDCVERRRHPWQHTKYRWPGESHPGAKLTADQVLSIREEYAQGATQKRLGQKYGVHHSTISLIVRRKKWGHL